MVKVGDRVQLTAAAIFVMQAAISEQLRELSTDPDMQFEGQVTDCDEKHAVVDIFDPHGARAITVELDFDDGESERLLTVITPTAAAVQDEPTVLPRSDATHPTQLDAYREQSAAAYHAAMQQSGPLSAGMMFCQSPLGAGPTPQRVVPVRVIFSQQIMAQFIGLKQYTIVQEIERNTPPQRIPGDEWKDNAREHKVANLKLTDAEGKLYDAALNRIRTWIEENDDPAAL